MMKYKDKQGKTHEIIFLQAVYKYPKERTAVFAFDKKTGALYCDITVNLPKYQLQQDECILSAEDPELIEAMQQQGYLIFMNKDTVYDNKMYRRGRIYTKILNRRLISDWHRQKK